MANKYIVDLTGRCSKTELCHLIKHGETSRDVKWREPHTLLHAAEGATDEEIAATLRVGLSTVHRTRPTVCRRGPGERAHGTAATGDTTKVGWQTGSLFSSARV